MDRAGDANNVYLADANSRLLKLPAGSTTPVALPFAGVKDPQGVAVDTAGNVYITGRFIHSDLAAVAQSSGVSSCGA